MLKKSMPARIVSPVNAAAQNAAVYARGKSRKIENHPP
jgi:hypothetical protein